MVTLSLCCLDKIARNAAALAAAAHAPVVQPRRRGVSGFLAGCLVGIWAG